MSMTQLIYHSPSSPDSVSPFDDAMLSVAAGRSIKITTPYVGLSYLKRLIGVSLGWRLISDVDAWLGSVNRSERVKAWGFIKANIGLIHHFPDLHAKTVISDAKGFLGSSNLTTAGILGRTEMGILVVDEDKVLELNQWFDELWAMSEPPSIEQGERFIKRLDLLPSAEKSAEEAFTSDAMRVRARLSDKKAQSVPTVTQVKPAASSTGKAAANTQCLIPEAIPLQVMGEFITRLVHALEFDVDKPMPDWLLLIKLTGLTVNNIEIATEILVRSKFIIKSDHQNVQTTYRLNDEFEWHGEWMNFYKAQDLWENKIDHLGKKIEMPKWIASTDISQNEQGLEVTELVPGKDHSYSSNLAFADSVYARLCNLLQENGGMLRIPTSGITVHPKYRLALLISKSKELGYDRLTTVVAAVLDGKVKGLPPSPFQYETLLDKELESVKKTFNEPSYISVVLKHAIDPKVFPETAKAFHQLRANHLGSNLPIITDRQSMAIDHAYLKFSKDAAGLVIPDEALDLIYKTIGIFAQEHENIIPYSLEELKQLIVAETKLDQSVIEQAFHQGSALQPKLLHLVRSKSLSVIGFRKELLLTYPRSMEVFNNSLVEIIEHKPQVQQFTNQGILIPVGRKAIAKIDRHYAELLHFIQLHEGRLPVGNPYVVGGILCKNKKGSQAIFRNILMNQGSGLPKAIYCDAGNIQKGMTFVFLNGLLSENDWDLLPQTKNALDRVGRSNFVTLKGFGAQTRDGTS